MTPVQWRYVYNNDEISEKEYRRVRQAGEGVSVHYDRITIDYPDYVALLVRRTFPQLERNLKPECMKLYKSYGARWQERNHCFVFPSGAKVYLVHCQDRKALDNYIGGNYHFLGIDEANQFRESWIDELSTCVRSSNPELKPQICLTSNPGNIGHIWLKKKFVDRCKPVPDGEMIFNEEFNISYQPFKTAETYYDGEGVSYQYIPATVFDNPALLDNDKKYVKKLKNLNPTLRAMWLEGRWDVFQGMYFDQWDEGVHVIDKNKFKYESDFSLNTHSFYRFYDYGTKNPFVCLFAVADSEGDIIVFDEIVRTGMAASEQVKFVTEYSRDNYNLVSDDFEMDIADPAFNTKHSEKEGVLYSPKMFYSDGGIFLTMGNNDRKAGAKVVYDGLATFKNSTPRIRFTSNCTYCIETIPALPSKPNDPEDVDTDGEDHAYDGLRYGAMKLLAGSTKIAPSAKGWREKISNLAYTSDYSGSWMAQ